MGILSFLTGKKKCNTASASLAKSRLQQIVIRKSDNDNMLNVIAEEIIDAIKKYTVVNDKNIKTLNHGNGLDMNAEVGSQEDECHAKFFDKIFQRNKPSSAKIAKSRLEISLKMKNLSFSDQLKKDVEDIVKQYANKYPEKIDIFMDLLDNKDCLVLEILLPKQP